MHQSANVECLQFPILRILMGLQIKSTFSGVCEHQRDAINNHLLNWIRFGFARFAAVKKHALITKRPGGFHWDSMTPVGSKGPQNPWPWRMHRAERTAFEF